MNTLNTIKNLIYCLPNSDIKFALKFIDIRDFESLIELIDSIIYKIKKNALSETPCINYLCNDINLSKIYNLKGLVSCYYMQIEGGDQLNEINNEENEEYY